MDVRGLPRLVRRRALLMAVVVLLGVGASVAYLVSVERTYRSSTTAFVSFASAAEPARVERVKSYAGLIEGTAVLQPVIDSLGLDETPQSLRRRVSAEAVDGTVLIRVTAHDSDRDRAAEIANAAAAQLSAAVSAVEGNGGTTPSTLWISKRADTARLVRPRPLLVLGTGLAAGLLAAVLLAAARDRGDRRLRSAAEAADLVGAPLLSEIPEYPADLVDLLLNPHSPPAGPYLPVWAGVQERLGAGVYLIAGAAPSEGRTTTAVELALSAAADGYRVLLVDAARRDPQLSRMFEVHDVAAGFDRLVAGRAEMDMAVHEIVLGGESTAWIVPCGEPTSLPPGVHRTDATQRLLARLKVRFDVIIVDTDPGVEDPQQGSLVRHCDALILTVRKGTDGAVLSRFLDRLALFGVKPDGFLLTFAGRAGRRATAALRELLPAVSGDRHAA